MEIVDLHCDLLLYLAMNPQREPFHPEARCSLPQLRAGNVKVQVLAIGCETNIYSLLVGFRQLEIYENLAKKYPKEFSKEHFVPAFENASCFALENEPLEDVFKRLESILSRISPLYISLTWNGENRFAGGCGSQSGLKPDGRELLRFLSKKGTAIDFSHASDKLAHNIIELIDTEHLDLSIMASHSNFRKVVDHVRNLPNEIAKEIIKRKGLIGLAFYNKFLKTPEMLYEMIDHGLKLGGKNTLAFGADFFCTEDLKPIIAKGGAFFKEMSDASNYPNILKGIQDQMQLQEHELQAIASQNALSFLSQASNKSHNSISTLSRIH